MVFNSELKAFEKLRSAIRSIILPIKGTFKEPSEIQITRVCSPSDFKTISPLVC